MTRQSGLYARYFVPVSLQPVLGSRYLVLSLLGERRDAARFTAARIGYVLHHLFEWMRTNTVANPKDLLELALRAARGNRRDLIIDLPDGTRITTDGSAADYEAAQRIVSPSHQSTPACVHHSDMPGISRTTMSTMVPSGTPTS